MSTKIRNCLIGRFAKGKEIYFEELKKLGFTDVTYRKFDGSIILENHTKGEK